MKNSTPKNFSSAILRTEYSSDEHILELESLLQQKKMKLFFEKVKEIKSIYRDQLILNLKREEDILHVFGILTRLHELYYQALKLRGKKCCLLKNLSNDYNQAYYIKKAALDFQHLSLDVYETFKSISEQYYEQIFQNLNETLVMFMMVEEVSSLERHYRKGKLRLLCA